MENRSWVALLISLILLSLAGAFVWLQISTPSDGARLLPEEITPFTEGLKLTPVELAPEGLQKGDILIAVEGRGIEAWSQVVFDRSAPRPGWEFGDTVHYTVLRDGQRLEIPVTLGLYPLLAILGSQWGMILSLLLSFLVAAFLFANRPDEPGARALFLATAGGLSSSTWALGLTVNDFVSGTGLWLYLLTTVTGYLLIWIGGTHFALVFPRPHRLISGRPWIVPGLYVVPYASYAIYAFALRANNPDPVSWFFQSSAPAVAIQLIYLILLLLAAVTNYRANPAPKSRQQVRWVIFAMVLTGVVAFAFAMVPETITGRPILSWNSVALFGLIVPVSIAIAVLRYRLFDIDLIINRTLVYGSLTALLAAAYFGSVTLFQQLIGTFLNQEPSSIATVLSTLLIAALFNPLRRRLQNAIDRRFYRQKYDAEQILAAFSAKLRDQVDLKMLSAALIESVEESMQPEHVSLWLRPPE